MTLRPRCTCSLAANGHIASMVKYDPSPYKTFVIPFIQIPIPVPVLDQKINGDQRIKVIYHWTQRTTVMNHQFGSEECRLVLCIDALKDQRLTATATARATASATGRRTIIIKNSCSLIDCKQPTFL